MNMKDLQTRAFCAPLIGREHDGRLKRVKDV